MDTMTKTHGTKSIKGFEVTVHILAWVYIFLSPIFFKRSEEPMDLEKFLHGFIFPFTTFVIFYANYFWFVPRLLIRGKLKWFVAANLLMIVCYQIVVEAQVLIFPPPHNHMQIRNLMEPRFPPKAYFVVRGLLTYVFAVAAAVGLQLSLRWKKSEHAREVAELGRSQAELQNLRNQINPHFLLNTLNNIYALTAFNQEKAQSAILELSRMLRYMLYDNQTDRVPLEKEVAFLKSYIALMRLRISDAVKVDIEFDYPENENLPVAPLIFISLVENAFKHGIATGRDSFITIRLQATHDRLHFSCRNSNAPKNHSDKTPGGIGLKLVAKRLELSYPGRHEWKYGTCDNDSTYFSEITIYDKER